MSTAAALKALQVMSAGLTLVNQISASAQRIQAGLLAAGDGDVPPELQKEADDLLELSRLRRDAAIAAAEGETTG